MLLQRLHFLRRLIPNQGIYKLKERVESPDSLFLFNHCMGYGLWSIFLCVIKPVLHHNYSLFPVPYPLLIILLSKLNFMVY